MKPRSRPRTPLALLALLLPPIALADPRPWEPPAPPADAPLRPAPARVVDYGDDYVHYRSDQFIFRGNTPDGRPILRLTPGLDLDGDGADDDSLSFVPFTLDYPTIPMPGNPLHWDWDREGTNHRIFISRTATLLDAVENVITESGGPNQDHSMGADDLNMMGWTRIKKNARFRTVGLWLWTKPDFLAGGDRYPVSVGPDARFALHAPRYWPEGDAALLRFVVRDGDRFFISEKTFAGGWGKTHLLRAGDSRWAPYTPRPPHHIDFDPDAATFKDRTFDDVRAAGYWIGTGWLSGFGVKLGAFELDALVHRPPTPSLTLSLRPVPAGTVPTPDGPAPVPAFFIAACETPWTVWQKTVRRAVSNCYAQQPGYYFDSDGRPASAELLRASAGPAEPAVRITLLDAVAFANALSEHESLTPVYYADPDFKTPFRCVVERLFFDKPCSPKVYVNWAADGYRLPTPAEFRRAADAGGPPHAPPDDPDNLPRAVAAGKPDALGLYDLAGNVWEWAWTAGNARDPDAPGFDPAFLVLAGPAADEPAARSASPYGDRPARGRFDIGFRLVRRAPGLDPPPTAPHPLGLPHWRFTPDTRTAAASKPEPRTESLLAMRPVPEGPLSVRLNWRESIPVTVSPFLVARTETTFRDWKTVQDWAIARGYRFNYLGNMGSDWHASETHSHCPDEPVTRLSWFDALIWCNALSEMESRRPCYYTDPERARPLRAALPVRHPMTQGEHERAAALLWTLTTKPEIHVDWSADGYRLPTPFEWQRAYAPREDAAVYWSDDSPDAFCWHGANAGGTTHPVATREPNALGLFDIAGNVDELCFSDASDLDPYDRRNPKGSLKRAERAAGGGQFLIPPQLGPNAFGRRALRRVKNYQAYPHTGFRVVRCEPGTHPADGDESASLVLLDLPADAPPERHQGACYRANTARTGEFKAAGVPALEGPRWTFPTGAPVRSSPVRVGGLVFFGSHDKTFYALRADTGEKAWSFETAGPIDSSPAVADGRVLFGSTDAHLYCLDAQTGRLLWKVRGLPVRSRQWRRTGRDTREQADVVSSPAVSWGLVFVGIAGRVRAFDLESGEEKWANLRAAQTQRLASPALAPGQVVYGHDHTRMSAFTVRNAAPHRLPSLGNCSKDNTPAVAGGLVCYTGTLGAAYCADLRTGKPRWITPAGSSAGREKADFREGSEGWTILCDPAVAGGLVLFGTQNGYLSAVDLESGKETWLFRTGGPVRSAPAVAADTVYFGSNDRNLYALELKTGELRWKFATGGPVRSSPWLGDGVLYVGSDDGRLYALQSP
jgi:outer membrane protein assembly factor BamB/formylglycine-generating enzyme required for sulfatase activity